MTGKVTHIGNYTLRNAGNRAPQTGCEHRELVLDRDAESVRCVQCGSQVSAYQALEMLAGEWDGAVATLRREAAELEKAKQGHLHLLAARKVEKAWRGRGTVPACPHCHRGILPEDNLGDRVVSRAIELRRREVSARAKSGTQE